MKIPPPPSFEGIHVENTAEKTCRTLTKLYFHINKLFQNISLFRSMISAQLLFSDVCRGNKSESQQLADSTQVFLQGDPEHRCEQHK